MKQKEASMAREQKKNHKELRLQLIEKNIEMLRHGVENIQEYIFYNVNGKIQECCKDIRKETATKEEEIQETLRHLADAIEENRKAIVYAPGGLVAEEAKKEFTSYYDLTSKKFIE